MDSPARGHHRVLPRRHGSRHVARGLCLHRTDYRRHRLSGRHGGLYLSSETGQKSSRLMLLEALLIYVGVIGSITVLYHLRGIAFIGDYLSTVVAILLMYPAVWHVRFRNLPVVFFEKTGSQLLKSLKLFAL